VAVALVLASTVAPSIARAQETAPPTEVQPPEVRRPYRGLFGSRPAPGIAQALDFTASLYGAYDDNVYADRAGIALTGPLRKSGWFGGLETGLNYTRHTRRLGFGAEGGVGLTTYEDEPLFTTYRAAANFNARVTRYGSFSITQAFVYAPEYRLGLFISPSSVGTFADPFVDLATDYGVFRQNSYRSSTNVGYTQELRQHASLSTFYSLSTANYQANELDYINQSAGARYNYQLTPNAGFHLGYSYGSGRYPNAPRFNLSGIHNIDAGLDYNKALSVSRRTHFSFSTGSALFYANEGATTETGRALNFALLGNANLTHEMGRTWTAALAYQRSVAFHEGFVEPFLAQSVSATLQGLLSRRLRFDALTSYTKGAVSVGTTNDFDSYTASAGLEYGLTRYLAAYTDYLYYQYTIPPELALDPRFPPNLSRNGVRFGIRTSLPVIRAK
jgi:opacity protein-like surface antigen